MSLIQEFLTADFSADYKQKVTKTLLNIEGEALTDLKEKYLTHVVRNGEILYMVAKKYGCKMNKLAELNPHICGKLRIEAGMELRIPVLAA